VRLQFRSRKSDDEVLLVLHNPLPLQYSNITSLFIHLTLSPFEALNLLAASLLAAPYKNKGDRYTVIPQDKYLYLPLGNGTMFQFHLVETC